MRIRKTITLENSDGIQEAVSSSGHERIYVSTTVRNSYRGELTVRMDCTPTASLLPLRTKINTSKSILAPNVVESDPSRLDNRKTQAIAMSISLDDKSRLWSAGNHGLEVHNPEREASDPSKVLRRRAPATTRSGSTHIVTSPGGKIWVSDGKSP